MVSKDDIKILAKSLGVTTRKSEVILRALPLEDVQAAGHTTFVRKVVEGLRPKRKARV